MRSLQSFLFVLLASISTIALAQYKVNYQAVARKSDGTSVANQKVEIRFSIHQTSATGTTVWQERDTTTTNLFGLFTLTIGNDLKKSGGTKTVFDSIQWQYGPYFLEVEIAENPPNAFVPMGTSELISTPYALYAKNAGGITKLPYVPSNINGKPNYLVKFNTDTTGVKSLVYDNGTSVAIGHASPASKTLLHVDAPGGGAKAGVLLPRLSALEKIGLASAINQAPNGLLVFDKLATRFSMWDSIGKQWLNLRTDLDIDTLLWTKKGNIVGAGDFLGSKNAAPVILKVNNIKSATFRTNSRFDFGDSTKATLDGTIVFGDLAGAPISTTPSQANEFTARYKNGYRFFTDNVLSDSNGVFLTGYNSNLKSSAMGVGIKNPAAKLHIVSHAKSEYQTLQLTSFGGGSRGAGITFNTPKGQWVIYGENNKLERLAFQKKNAVFMAIDTLGQTTIDNALSIGDTMSYPNSRLNIIEGHLTSTQKLQPTIVPGSVANGITVTISTNYKATDVAGGVFVNIGAVVNSGTQLFQFKYDKQYNTPPIVQISTTSSTNPAPTNLYVTSQSDRFTISTNGVINGGTKFDITYFIIETH